MKKSLKLIILFFPLLLMILFIQCKEKKSYSVTFEGDNLYITMPYPRVGISGINKRDWKDFTLNDVIEGTFNKLKDSTKSGIITIWVRLENPKTDKYGNEEMRYDSQVIAKVPVSEVKKYKNYKYFDDSYRITDSINRAIEGNTRVLEFPSF